MSGQTGWRKVVFLVLAMIGGMAAGGSQTVVAAEQLGVTPEMKELARRQQAFAVALYARQSAEPGNLLVSPYSLATALGMTAEGARGETATQMAATLHLNGWDAQKRRAATVQMLDRLAGGGAERPYTLTVANALWPMQGVALTPVFEGICRTTYRTKVQGLNFADAAGARRTINDWVAAATAKHIPEIVPADGLDDRTRLVLTNAVYFKGQWASAFEAANTHPQAWHGLARATVPTGAAAGGAVKEQPLAQVSMMSQEVRLPYWSNVGQAKAPGVQLQIVELPYLGGSLSMVILLPPLWAAPPATGPTALAAVEHALAEGMLDEWLAHLAPTKVELHLPRFTVRDGADLSQPLAGLGMPAAFDPVAADFTGMATYDRNAGNWYVAHVWHQAYVEVNEQGTVAAAATAVSHAASIDIPAPPTVVLADHPFIFLIRDRESGAILFLGRLVQP